MQLRWRRVTRAGEAGRFTQEDTPAAPERTGPVTPEDFSEPLRSYYQANPQDLDLDILNSDELQPLNRADSAEYGDEFILAEAWSAAMGAVGPRADLRSPGGERLPPGKGR